MTEITAEGRAVASPTIIDSKNGAVPKPSVKAGKKTVTDDLMATFNSPAAWLLVFALIITWSAVAIVMFDLIDYKSYVDEIEPPLKKKGVIYPPSKKKVSKAAVTRTPAKRKPTAKKPIVHPAEGKQAKPKPKPKEIKKVEAAAARRRKTSIVESVKPGKGKAKPAKPTAKPAAEKHTRPHTKELAKRKAPPPAVRKTKELKKPAAKSREVKPKQKAVLKVVKAKDSKPVKGKNLNYYLSEPEKKERPAPKVSAKIKPPKTRMVGSVGKLRTKAKAEKPKTAKPQWRKEKAIAAQAKKEQPVKKKEEQAKPTEKAKLSKVKAKPEKQKERKPIVVSKEKAKPARAPTAKPKVTKEEKKGKPAKAAKSRSSKLKAVTEGKQTKPELTARKEEKQVKQVKPAEPKVTKEEKHVKPDLKVKMEDKRGKPETKRTKEEKRTKPETKTAKEEKQLKPARVTRDKTTRNVKGREPAPTVAAGRRAMATTKPAKVQVPKREPAKKERAAVSRSEKSSIVQKKHAREVIRKAPVINETTQYCNTGTGVSETSAFQNRGKAPVRFFQCVFMEGNNGRTSHLPSGHKADKNPSARKTRSPGH
ncbi:triadin isoform X34 [Latimeria chalumnae]|uniref:triadin isoform X34 n=1 Tax=Latimeria chalumnae TaxID=7897 RepID=UPI00313E78C0